MNTIYKYPLVIKDVNRVVMNPVVQPLCVQLQRGVLTLWAVVDVSQPKRQYDVLKYITGGEAPEYPTAYLGTTQSENGTVHHWFWKGEVK